MASHHFLVHLATMAILLSQPRPSSSAVLYGMKRHRESSSHHQSSSGNHSHCDIFTGSWVRGGGGEEARSYASGCPWIDPQFNCQLYGRPDSDYQSFQWRPIACELPRFDALFFLERMRGRTLVFVGDSLGRNQWESLLCMLSAALPAASPTHLVRADPLSTFQFLDYAVSVNFYRTPYLVDIDTVQGKKVLRLDDISANAAAWRDADVLSFNSGHWWTHRGSLQGWDYISDGGEYYTDMDRLVAFQKGLRTWASWVDANVDSSRTRVFFQSISPTHYNPSEWGDPVSKNCYGETVPVSGWTYTGVYPDQMRVLVGVLGAMKRPPYLLDITNLSGLRKDGHPSIYSGDLSPDQRANPDRSADCSHWCLPGLPDTWNRLFYTALFF